jgi:hypothetical protein
MVLGYLMEKAINDATTALKKAKQARADPATIVRLQEMVDKLRVAQMEKIIERSDIEVID